MSPGNTRPDIARLPVSHRVRRRGVRAVPIAFLAASLLAMQGFSPAARAAPGENSAPVRQRAMDAGFLRTAPAEEGARLERLVLVARHGIRSPTQDPLVLGRLTGRVWPRWPVGPGQLTPHGRDALRAMTEGLAEWYDLSCHGDDHPCLADTEPVIWADSADARTLESGAIMARGLGASRIVSHHAGEHDPVFTGMAADGAIQKEKDRSDGRDEAHDVLLADRHERPEAVREGLSRLQALFAPQGCDAGQSPCFSAPLRSASDGRLDRRSGPALGASVSENLLLVYLQKLGTEGDSPAWLGRIDPSLLAAVLPVHTYLSDLTRRRGVRALRRGEGLAAVIGKFLTGEGVRLPDGSGPDRRTRLLVLAGHDTTLDALAGYYGLSWNFVDQPDPTAPDTVLAFERWRLRDGRAVTRAVVFHQSLDALRQAAAPDMEHGGRLFLGEITRQVPRVDSGTGVKRPGAG